MGPAWFNLGLAHHLLGDPGEAAAALQQVVQLQPGRAEAYHSLGVAEEQLGHLPEALQAFGAAHRIVAGSGGATERAVLASLFLTTQSACDWRVRASHLARLRAMLQEALLEPSEDLAPLLPAASSYLDASSYLQAGLHRARLLAPPAPAAAPRWDAARAGAALRVGFLLDEASLPQRLDAREQGKDGGSRGRQEDWGRRLAEILTEFQATRRGQPALCVLAYIVRGGGSGGAMERAGGARGVAISSFADAWERATGETEAAAGGGGSGMCGGGVRDLSEMLGVAGGRGGEEAASQVLASDAVQVLVAVPRDAHRFPWGLLARRAAPLQMVLGLRGSAAQRAVDVAVSDRVVAPPDLAAHYAERLALLPPGALLALSGASPADLLPHRGRPALADAAERRAAMGLPRSGSLLCAFAEAWQLSPELLDAWAWILARVPGAILWLPRLHALAEENLRGEAAARGIAASRFLFSPAQLRCRPGGRCTRTSSASHVSTLSGGLQVASAHPARCRPGARACSAAAHARARAGLASQLEEAEWAAAAEAGSLVLDSFPLSAPLPVQLLGAAGLPCISLATERAAGRAGAALLRAGACAGRHFRLPLLPAW
jgi:tetratricopeptide (TPR) repeat protein